MDLNNYPGSKGQPGVYHTIINHIPEHQLYCELFAGSGIIAKKLYEGSQGPQRHYMLCDIDPELTKTLLTIMPAQFRIINSDAINVINILKELCAIRVLESKDIFVYLDPPYLKSTRRSDRDIYKYEYTADDHIQLISTIIDAPFKIMISGYSSKLYNDSLKNWSIVKFQSQTRKGPATECLWMNYNIHEFDISCADYLGNDFSDRQRIKRKRQRIIKRITNLPEFEKKAVIQALLEDRPL